MHYALYRKYRPKTFGEVVGQEHVTTTLKAQVKSGQFSHSYLFTGTRGTGKTSCAKILARAVNCLSPRDGEPCNECEICKGLLSGEIYDVSEIDAASNNSVDNIRQIRDEIMFSPMKTKYRVYIIDEVHMLSSGAFNALLKTLEEPPEHVIFILATTEAHKIPPTILSRCQRFDMHRLSLNAIADHLKKIAAAEGRVFPDDIINMVASLADGSVRDSLSILDKVMETEDPYMIKAALGICDSETLFALSSQIADGDIDGLFSTVADFYSSSKDFSVLFHDLIEHFRFLLIARTAKSPEKFMEKSEEDKAKYKKQSSLFGVEQILYILDTLKTSLSNLSRSPDKRAEAEICFLKCARPELEKDSTPLAARVSKLETAISGISSLGLSANKDENLTERVSGTENGTVKNTDGKSEKLSGDSFSNAVFDDFSDKDFSSDANKTAVFDKKNDEISSRYSEKSSPERTISNNNSLNDGNFENNDSFLHSQKKTNTENTGSETSRKKAIIKDDPASFFDEVSSDEASDLNKSEVSAFEKESDKSDLSNPSGEGEYREFLSFKTLASSVRRKDITIGIALARYCEAVYRDKELIILCKSEKDREEVSSPEARKLIEEALKEDCKESYKVKFDIGSKEKYLSEEQREFSDIYEHLEESDLFTF